LRVSLVFIALVTAFKGAANSALKNLGSVVGRWDFLMGCLSALAWVGVWWRAAIYT